MRRFDEVQKILVRGLGPLVRRRFTYLLRAQAERLSMAERPPWRIVKIVRAGQGADAENLERFMD